MVRLVSSHERTLRVADHPIRQERQRPRCLSGVRRRLDQSSLRSRICFEHRDLLGGAELRPLAPPARQFSRVIMFDKRGTGLSDRLERLPTMDERMDDVRAVMDAANSQQAAVFGLSEGGSLATLFAAHYPERCRALVLWGAFAQFSSWFPTAERLDGFFDYVEKKWGTGAIIVAWAPAKKDDPAFREWFAKRERTGASPAAASALMLINSQIDIFGILPYVRVPTLVVHRTQDPVVRVEGGRQLANSIPNARLLECRESIICRTSATTSNRSPTRSPNFSPV